MPTDVTPFVSFVLNQGVAVAVLTFLLIRLENRLERIDRILTALANHVGIPLSQIVQPD